VRETRLGVAVELRLTPPTTASVVESKSDLVAVAYGAVRVRVRPSDVRADRLLLHIDYTRSVGPVALPDIQHPVGLPLDPLRPFALGIDDDGAAVEGQFYGHHLLVGGIPGSGKSNALRVFLAHLATSRNVVLYGIDPKRVELGLWRDRFSGLVLGNGAGETIALLEALHDLISERTQHLSAIGETILLPTQRFPWVVLVVDEWAEVAAGGSKKERDTANDLLRRYVSLGRAVGCTAILCTQRPTSDVIDVGTRTLLNDRFALRCGDRHQAEAILSAGTFESEDLIGTTVGRALWSNGGPAKAFQVYSVEDSRIPELTCAGFRFVQA
jgi:S-DNA-T family DNA segregation ATPase FtsK/SpoIIIE